jgi:hypothetical protein
MPDTIPDIVERLKERVHFAKETVNRLKCSSVSVWVDAAECDVLADALQRLIPAGGADEREDLAQVIDPEAFELASEDISLRDAVARRSRARLAADRVLSHRSRSVDGWKLVPTKHDGCAGLTHEMCDAFWAAYDRAGLKHGQFESTNAGYNAMIDAAPTPPQASQGETNAD